MAKQPTSRGDIPWDIPHQFVQWFLQAWEVGLAGSWPAYPKMTHASCMGSAAVQGLPKEQRQGLGRCVAIKSEGLKLSILSGFFQRKSEPKVISTVSQCGSFDCQAWLCWGPSSLRPALNALQLGGRGWLSLAYLVSKNRQYQCMMPIRILARGAINSINPNPVRPTTKALWEGSQRNKRPAGSMGARAREDSPKLSPYACLSARSSLNRLWSKQDRSHPTPAKPTEV